ncbi:hypothetical protein N7541_008321 [Penicillium brevicompactum]|uniref:Uncharacterized protein n=1 Tax=Penicillium brevicompactum TaxID=5074 RepID=A0A9W9R134_PENBR|nr:hypothetical protein N7541_008321 [Penicillium brevicompactum]
MRENLEEREDLLKGRKQELVVALREGRDLVKEPMPEWWMRERRSVDWVYGLEAPLFTEEAWAILEFCRAPVGDLASGVTGSSICGDVARGTTAVESGTGREADGIADLYQNFLFHRHFIEFALPDL